MGLLDPVLKKVSHSVRQSAVEFGGACSWPFTQMYGEVATVIGKNKVTKDGICEMLSAFWIERLAAGSHLSSYIGKPGLTGATGVDPSKIRQMMQLFIIGSEMSPGSMVGQDSWVDGSDQTRATKTWLGAKSIRYNAKTTSNRGKGGHSNFGSELGKAIVNMGIGGGTKGTYATIGIWGGGGGHAMAAHLVGNSTIYFDPNFGEFMFGDSEQFKAWFTRYWYLSFYGRKWMGQGGLSDKYEVMTYLS